MSQPHMQQQQSQLYKLTFQVGAWQHVSMCLTIRGSLDKPYDTVVPIPTKKGTCTLIVCEKLIFNAREWKAVCPHTNIVFPIKLTPVRA